MARKIAQFKDDRGRWQDLPVTDYRLNPEVTAMEASKTGMTTRVIEIGAGEDGEDKVVRVFKRQRKGGMR
jgi:hypothetical protein